MFFGFIQTKKVSKMFSGLLEIRFCSWAAATSTCEDFSMVWQSEKQTLKFPCKDNSVSWDFQTTFRICIECKMNAWYRLFDHLIGSQKSHSLIWHCDSACIKQPVSYRRCLRMFMLKTLQAILYERPRFVEQTFYRAVHLFVTRTLQWLDFERFIKRPNSFQRESLLLKWKEQKRIESFKCHLR